MLLTQTDQVFLSAISIATIALAVVEVRRTKKQKDLSAQLSPEGRLVGSAILLSVTIYGILFGGPIWLLAPFALIFSAIIIYGLVKRFSAR